MTPERLAAIRDQVEWERAQTGLYFPRELPGKANLDRADLLDEVLRLRAGIEALCAHAHRTHDHGWGQLLDVVIRPDGEDLADYVAMHEADLTERGTDDR